MKQAGFTLDTNSGLYTKTFNNLPYGTYMVTEIDSGIGGYTLSNTSFTSKDNIVLSASNKTDTVALADIYTKDPTPANGTLTLKKTVTGCDALSATPVNFYVTDSNGNYFDKDGNNCGTTKTAIVVTPGTPVVVSLPDGVYDVTEDVPTDPDYNLMSTSVTSADNITIDSNTSDSVTLQNIYEKKSVTPGPTDTPAPTAGPTTPAPTGSPTAAPIATPVVTPVTTPIPTATAAPVNPSDLSIDVSIQNPEGQEIGQAILAITSIDGYDIGSITVTQNGTTITPTVSDDNHTISFVSDSNATTIIKGLKPGTYKIVETTSPEQYLTAEATEIVLNDDGSVLVGGTLIAAGSRIVLVSKINPDYVGTANKNSAVPATGETSVNNAIFAGIAMCAMAAFIMAAVWHRKMREEARD